MPKTIFYYQTFKDINENLISLEPILYDTTPLSHIHVSSIHFGIDENQEPYIHLNNRSPYNSYFDEVWEDIENASKKILKLYL